MSMAGMIFDLSLEPFHCERFLAFNGHSRLASLSLKRPGRRANEKRPSFCFRAALEKAGWKEREQGLVCSNSILRGPDLKRRTTLIKALGIYAVATT